ncbi:3-deoxy-D-manno-octulosonic acid transferase [Phaeovulum sp.]|uniref:3-deoxy-D-manno-octulosonic acid transferase n=1 Tax=Phaeovulum sp. TaxID=2934796 RepID=UPI003569C4D1
MQQAIGAIILALYLALTALAAPLLRWLLARRAATGREDPQRWREKLGVAGAVRPEGQLLWLHAASVGELLSVVSLVQALAKARPGLGLLVTTSTITSARLAATRLPAHVVHQYLPLDTPRAVTRFLDHWHPDVAVWVESEFWPRLIEATAARGVPMLLVNARVSDRSARRWQRMGALAQRLLSHFSQVLAQDAQSARNLLAIGLAPERLTRAGSLKESAAALPVDSAERARLRALWSARPRWLAASTHAGEEAEVFAAQRAAAAALPGLLLILAPRHPIRGPALAAEARAAGFSVAERSSGQGDAALADVYLADTLGEMGLWFDLAPVAFLGGSLVPVGGHNPYEPVAQGAAVLHGPEVGNFREVYARLDAAGAALAVADAAALAAALPRLLADDASAARAQAQTAQPLLADAGEGAEAAALAALLGALDAASAAKLGARPL